MKSVNILAALALLAVGCATHGYPVSARWTPAGFVCQDAAGREWASGGECD